MNAERQLSATVKLDVGFSVTQFMLGGNIVDERGPKLESYGFVMASVFMGPFRVSVIWEPRRMEYIAEMVAIAARQKNYERGLAALRRPRK